MLMTHIIWQTVWKPLSVTDAKNGAITPSLTPTMHIIHVGCYQASECVGGEFTVQARYLGDLVDDGIFWVLYSRSAISRSTAHDETRRRHLCYCSNE